MGKSLIDMFNSLGAKTHTRKFEVCSGVAYNSTYQTELGDDSLSTVLEVNGKGRIVAILPITTSSNFYGQIKVYTDNNKMIAGSNYYQSGYIYPFLIGSKFQELLGYSRYQSNSYYTRLGLALPMIDTSVRYFDFLNEVMYSKDYSSFYNFPQYPKLFDDSSGSNEGAFNNSLKIMASQTGSSGSSYIDTYTKILVIYDLED